MCFSKDPILYRGEHKVLEMAAGNVRVLPILFGLRIVLNNSDE
jgi:hypothetical protein